MFHAWRIAFVFMLFQAGRAMAQVPVDTSNGPTELSQRQPAEDWQPIVGPNRFQLDNVGTGNLDQDSIAGPNTCGTSVDCDSKEGPQLDVFRGYRVKQGGIEWIVGDGNQFGMFSFGSDHYAESGLQSGLEIGLRFQFLAGPDRTDMPPRVFDFSIGYQKRQLIGGFAYDVAIAVLAASDFEGSSRDGVRFPGHAVGYLTLTDSVDVVFGADFLDRADIRLLPVAGLIWCPTPVLRLELVFPTPRIDWQITDKRRLYLNGGLGGDTWAIERDSELDDLVTYRDLRIGIGLERIEAGDTPTAIEIAFLFDRKLEFRSGDGDYRPNGTVMIRAITRY